LCPPDVDLRRGERGHGRRRTCGVGTMAPWLSSPRFTVGAGRRLHRPLLRPARLLATHSRSPASVSNIVLARMGKWARAYGAVGSHGRTPPSPRPDHERRAPPGSSSTRSKHLHPGSAVITNMRRLPPTGNPRPSRSVATPYQIRGKG
jgi:hypothetical protein